MSNEIKPALRLLLVLTLLTGVVYPLAVTGAARLLFPHQAGGSPVHDRQGRIVGSELIGQPFSGAAYFWGRPSATSPPYDAAASSGSNLGPANPALRERVAATFAALQEAHGMARPIPVDLVTASASGLDPHLSPAAVEYQVERVARARGLAPEAVRRLVARHLEGRQLGLLGEPRVNVLALNLELDALPDADRDGPRYH